MRNPTHVRLSTKRQIALLLFVTMLSMVLQVFPSSLAVSAEPIADTVTENMESPLAQAADVVLKQHVNRETDKWNAQGTTSTTALCMIFHALQAAMIEQTGYQAEQFALIHPGGAVGERLNNKAL